MLSISPDLQVSAGVPNGTDTLLSSIKTYLAIRPLPAINHRTLKISPHSIHLSICSRLTEQYFPLMPRASVSQAVVKSPEPVPCRLLPETSNLCIRTHSSGVFSRVRQELDERVIKPTICPS